MRKLAVVLAFALATVMKVPVLAQDSTPGGSTNWNAKLDAIDKQLRQGHWEAGRLAAQSVTEALIEHSGGTLGDHRATADELGGSVASSAPPAEAILLGRAAALRAIAEVGVERKKDEGRWHWYLAQNLYREVRIWDLTVYGNGKVGQFLQRNLLVDADAEYKGLVDVLDPVNPEATARQGFKPPVRTQVVYPRRPQDLRDRDRFSHVVFVQVTVDEHGHVVQPEVVDGGFYPGLIYKAFEALREWRYQPATLNGKAVPFRFVVPIVFADDRPDSPGVIADARGPSPTMGVVETEHTLNRAAGLTVELTSGLIYVADKGSSTIFQISPEGEMKQFAGTGQAGFNGDGKKAIETQLNHPSAVSMDPRTAELFIADTSNYRIRAISPNDFQVRTTAGIGLAGVPAVRVPYDTHTPESLTVGHFSGDDGPATEAELNLPSGICADPVGILFIADSGNNRIRAVNRGTSPVIVMGEYIEPGAIKTIAGTGTAGFSGDEQKATWAQLAFPTELKVDASGNLLVVDSFNQRLRRIDRWSGIIHTVATGATAEIGASRALTSWTTSVVGVGVTADQEIIYADRVDHSIHRISRGGDNRVVYSAPARETEFASVEVGPRGEIYVVDVHGNRVLRIDNATNPLPDIALNSHSASSPKTTAGQAFLKK